MGQASQSVLVIDDDPDVLKLIERILAHDGVSVITAADPGTALTLYETERPCLLVVDLMLPQMDGEELVQSIVRRYGERPPVIILSASAVRSEVAHRIGAEASLAKPFDIDDLRDTVARFCET